MKMFLLSTGMKFSLRIPSPSAALLLAAGLALCAASTMFAQGPIQPAQPAAAPPPPVTYMMSFKDGKSVAATSFRRSGAEIVATVLVNDQKAELAYPIGAIERINFPEPAQIDSCTQLVLDGKFNDALAKIEPTIGYYQSFKDVPGNWWGAAALVKLKALQYLHQDAAANSLISEMASSAPANSEAARLASVLQASVTASSQPEKALAVYDDVIKSSTNDVTLGYAWACKADSLYALQKFEPAVLAYLHVPVFYPDARLLLPGVLMASGKCFVHIEHLPDAEKAFNDIITQFPSSPEAAAAKAELKKIAKPQDTTVAASQTSPSDSNTNSNPASSPGESPAPAAGASPAATPPSNP